MTAITFTFDVGDRPWMPLHQALIDFARQMGLPEPDVEASHRKKYSFWSLSDETIREYFHLNATDEQLGYLATRVEKRLSQHEDFNTAFDEIVQQSAEDLEIPFEVGHGPTSYPENE